MDRSRVSESWVGRQVILIPLNERGESGNELRGWLRGIEDEGVVFAKAFHSDSFNKLMPEAAKFYPWTQIGLLEPHNE